MDLPGELRVECVSIEPLIRFAAEDTDGQGVVGRTERGKRFAREVRKLIPEQLGLPGFYCWCGFSPEGRWVPYYVGQSHVLERRLLENVKNGRVAIWVHAGHSLENLLELGAAHYPEKWSEYRRHWERHLRKAGATYIAWVRTPAWAHLRLELIEAALIRRWAPAGNTQNTGEQHTLDKLSASARQEILHRVELVARAFEEAPLRCESIPGVVRKPGARRAIPASPAEKAAWLWHTWGDKFRQYNFGPESSIDDFNGLLGLIERFGGFDDDDPEAAMVGDQEVFENFRRLSEQPLE